MPMELLFTLAQGSLPRTLANPGDIDKLRVIAAAQLVQAQLPDVGASEQTAQVLAITWEGRHALAKAYPGHRFSFATADALAQQAFADWLPSLDSCQMERDTSRSTLDS